MLKKKNTKGNKTREMMSIFALPWARLQLNTLFKHFRQNDTSAAVVGAVEAEDAVVAATAAVIGGEGVTARDIVRDGVPMGDAEEAGEGHRDGDGDDLAELLRE